MQLKRPGRLRSKLAQISAALIASSFSAAQAADTDPGRNGFGYEKPNNVFGLGTAYSQIDAAMLVYAERGGRVSAIEPTANLAIHGADGRQLTVNLTADAVSGATPNGAIPASVSQNFVTPLKAVGSSVTVTSASGGSTVIQLPPTAGQLASAALGRQYTVPANTLPEDRGFHDHRAAIAVGWSQPSGRISEVGISAGFSREEDYQAFTANTHISQNFNANNTTASLSLNLEFDTSSPFGGIPTGLTDMSGQWKSPGSRDKTQLGFVLGITQVLTRRWLAQLNYSFDQQNGYQTDPYRVISVVDPATGNPARTLYENRPSSRQTNSLYLDNKLDFAPFITDIGLRYYTDSWNIRSFTAEISERANLGKYVFVEPSFRWYRQTAASFFSYYLVNGPALPAYASSDSRLGAFDSVSIGAKLGLDVSPRSEFYIKGEYYDQTGNGHPADAIGQLKRQDLFSGVKATIVFLGYTYDFH